MVWYYVKNNQQTGPIEEATFAELVRRGTVGPDTLVWNDSLSEWIPCSRAYRENLPTTAVMPGGICICQECGRQFPDDQVVPLAEGFVCSACKPMALRKMQEGIAGIGTREFAGFWIRFAAKLIDGLILGFVLLVVFLVLMFFIMAVMFGAVAGNQEKPNETLFIGLLLMCQFACYGILCCIPICYETFFIGKYGATPGKMAVGIKVIRTDHSRITYLRALGRSCASVFFSSICYIGYIIAAFDDEKRSLHDHVCDTRVVYK